MKRILSITLLLLSVVTLVACNKNSGPKVTYPIIVDSAILNEGEVFEYNVGDSLPNYRELIGFSDEYLKTPNASIIVNDSSVLYTELGSYDFSVSVVQGDAKHDYSFSINVVDTKAPTVQLTQTVFPIGTSEYEVLNSILITDNLGTTIVDANIDLSNCNFYEEGECIFKLNTTDGVNESGWLQYSFDIVYIHKPEIKNINDFVVTIGSNPVDFTEGVSFTDNSLVVETKITSNVNYENPGLYLVEYSALDDEGYVTTRYGHILVKEHENDYLDNFRYINLSENEKQVVKEYYDILDIVGNLDMTSSFSENILDMRYESFFENRLLHELSENQKTVIENYNELYVKNQIAYFKHLYNRDLTVVELENLETYHSLSREYAQKGDISFTSNELCRYGISCENDVTISMVIGRNLNDKELEAIEFISRLNQLNQTFPKLYEVGVYGDIDNLETILRGFPEIDKYITTLRENNVYSPITFIDADDIMSILNLEESSDNRIIASFIYDYDTRVAYSKTVQMYDYASFEEAVGLLTAENQYKTTNELLNYLEYYHIEDLFSRELDNAERETLLKFFKEVRTISFDKKLYDTLYDYAKTNGDTEYLDTYFDIVTFGNIDDIFDYLYFSLTEYESFFDIELSDEQVNAIEYYHEHAKFAFSRNRGLFEFEENILDILLMREYLYSLDYTPFRGNDVDRLVFSENQVDYTDYENAYILFSKYFVYNTSLSYNQQFLNNAEVRDIVNQLIIELCKEDRFNLFQEIFYNESFDEATINDIFSVETSNLIMSLYDMNYEWNKQLYTEYYSLFEYNSVSRDPELFANYMYLYNNIGFNSGLELKNLAYNELLDHYGITDTDELKSAYEYCSDMLYLNEYFKDYSYANLLYEVEPETMGLIIGLKRMSEEADYHPSSYEDELYSLFTEALNRTLNFGEKNIIDSYNYLALYQTFMYKILESNATLENEKLVLSKDVNIYKDGIDLLVTKGISYEAYISSEYDIDTFTETEKAILMKLDEQLTKIQFVEPVEYIMSTVEGYEIDDVIRYVSLVNDELGEWYLENIHLMNIGNVRTMVSGLSQDEQDKYIGLYLNIAEDSNSLLNIFLSECNLKYDSQIREMYYQGEELYKEMDKYSSYRFFQPYSDYTVNENAKVEFYLMVIGTEAIPRDSERILNILGGLDESTIYEYTVAMRLMNKLGVTVDELVYNTGYYYFRDGTLTGNTMIISDEDGVLLDEFIEKYIVKLAYYEITGGNSLPENYSTVYLNLFIKYRNYFHSIINLSSHSGRHDFTIYENDTHEWLVVNVEDDLTSLEREVITYMNSALILKDIMEPPMYRENQVLSRSDIRIEHMIRLIIKYCEPKTYITDEYFNSIYGRDMTVSELEIIEKHNDLSVKLRLQETITYTEYKRMKLFTLEEKEYIAGLSNLLERLQCNTMYLEEIYLNANYEVLTGEVTEQEMEILEFLFGNFYSK